MAFPTVADVTETGVSSASTTHNQAMPATVNSGELLCMTSVFENLVTITTPSGWTDLISTGAVSVHLRIADGTEGGTTVNVVTNNAEQSACQVYRIQDWFGSLAGVEAGTQNTGSSSSPDPGSVTASWGAEDNLFIAQFGANDDDAAADIAPTNYTNLVSTVSGGGINAGATVGSARRELASATDNPGAFTLDAGELWRAFTLVVRPAAAAGANLPAMMHQYRQRRVL